MAVRAVTLAAIMLAGFFLAGCGGGSSINPKEVGACPPGEEITGRQLRVALRREGFSAVCLKGVYGAQVANATPTGQGDTDEHEGTVICVAAKYMPPRTEHHPHKIYEYRSAPGHSGPGRDLLLANVDCSLYLYPRTRPDAASRIRHAFSTLAARRY